MTPVGERLARLISLQGPISLDRYMMECLYNPKDGFYSTANPFGEEGHFFTSPEISSLFGEIIGLWAILAWEKAGTPAPFSLIEAGPGRGLLFADMMRACRIRPAFQKAARPCLIETSPFLRKEQEKKLKEFSPEFYETPDNLPERPSFFIANEFFDALPVKQFIRRESGWQERLIDYSEEKSGFFFTSGPLIPPSDNDNKNNDAESLGDFPAQAQEGQIFEFSPSARLYLDQIVTLLRRNGGAGLIIDYGFSKKHDSTPLFGTLQALYRHKHSDPLEKPGLCDLSSHIPFDSYIYQLKKAGLSSINFSSQSSFLQETGFNQLFEKKCLTATNQQRQELNRARHKLTSVEEMGHLFKVLSFSAD